MDTKNVVRDKKIAEEKQETIVGDISTEGMEDDKIGEGDIVYVDKDDLLKEYFT